MSRISDAVYAETEDHRHACEVRYVQSLDGAAQYRFLQGVAKQRGKAAADRLRLGIGK